MGALGLYNKACGGAGGVQQGSMLELDSRFSPAPVRVTHQQLLNLTLHRVHVTERWCPQVTSPKETGDS